MKHFLILSVMTMQLLLVSCAGISTPPGNSPPDCPPITPEMFPTADSGNVSIWPTGAVAPSGQVGNIEPGAGEGTPSPEQIATSQAMEEQSYREGPSLDQPSEEITPDTQPAGPGISQPGSGTSTVSATPTQIHEESQQPYPLDENSNPTLCPYANAEYKFKVNYPSNYKFYSLSADMIAQFQSTPAAGWVFLSPEKASSYPTDLEPPDLAIWVFDAQGVTSLQDWLSSAGLLEGNSSNSFKTASASGIQLCATTAIFPGCSYYFLGQGWVYQLTPASPVGEEMVQTFTITQ